ncbi:MAG: alanine racemase [Planctomycetota bacterium]
MTRFTHLDTGAYALPSGVLERTQTPALVVHLEAVRENLRRMIAYAGSPDRWRPHVKTTKIPAVWAEVARAGVRHFKCATTREARLLAEVLVEEGVGAADVCLAYPLRGPGLAALGEIARAFPAVRVSVLCEDAELLPDIPPEVSIFVDVNPGMHRTGIPAEDGEAILAVARGAGARLRGIHFYDGHLHGADLAARRSAIHRGYDRLLLLREALLADGLAVGELVTSGTPSFLHALAYPGFEGLAGTVHRISPGTVVFHDLRSEEENPDLELLPAAVVAARVVSHPAADVVTCDAGSKSLAAEAGDPSAFVLGRPELAALSPSEEHLPLRVTAGERPARGEVLFLVPRHVCPTVNLAEEALLVDGGEARAVRVAARAHELLGSGAR